MDASILVVGDSQFRPVLLASIRDVADFSIESVSNPREAEPLIQAQQPDLLLMQASQPGCLELCRYIKDQIRLAWIYCILLSNLPQEPSPALADQPNPLPPTDALPNEPELLDPLQIHIAALEAGADAYHCLWFQQPTPAQKRLLVAQIQAGLRRVQTHRDLIRKNDLLSAIALSDPLTELNNRRALEWELPRQVQNARLRQMPLSLIMLDVDFFKNINDRHGHLVGDRALQLLSARLRHNLRFYDTPFRYGGEEFVIILGDTGCQEATLIAQRLCQLVSEQPFVISDSLDLVITISAGASCLVLEDDTRGMSLLQRADQNLLTAKAQGRNQVVGNQDTPDRL